ncbi:hypothetical protein K8I28_07965 [bacterium]|nr:hypothetical protein [bacterium]
MFRIGIRREDKTDQERRAPLAPHHVRQLIKDNVVEIYVERAEQRVYSHDEYENAGAKVVDDLPECDLIMGVKEIPVSRLHAGKPHLFFSHTIKGQEYNMPLLQSILDQNCTLMDYEVVTDEQNRRLVFFGVQAGQAGMLNSLWSLGQRYQNLGIETPFKHLRQAKTYPSLDEAREAVSAVGEMIRREGLPKQITPFICGITGYGKVSQGAQEIYDLLKPETVHPEELSKMRDGTLFSSANRVYKTVFKEEHFVKRIDNTEPFNLQEYFSTPELYTSSFAQHFPYLNCLINAIYWDDRYPRLITWEDLTTILEKNYPLAVVGDITCDIDGSIQFTVEATEPNNPVYVINPDSRKPQYGFEGDGIQMMTVDILPTAIPRDSTNAFGDMLVPFIPGLAKTDFTLPFDKLNCPPEFKRAIIAHQGKLTPEFTGLEEFLKK